MQFTITITGRDGKVLVETHDAQTLAQWDFLNLAQHVASVTIAPC